MSLDLDLVLRALSHPDRRRFVLACRDNPRPAGELAELSSLSPAAVSEHLKLLRLSGLLVLDRRGRHWLYKTDPAVLSATLKQLRTML